MSTEFSFKDYSPAPDYYIPPDEADTTADASWSEYTELARTVPPDDLMLAVSEGLLHVRRAASTH